MIGGVLVINSSVTVKNGNSKFSGSRVMSPVSGPSAPAATRVSPSRATFIFLHPGPSGMYDSLVLSFVELPSHFTDMVFVPSFDMPQYAHPATVQPMCTR